MNFCRAAKEDYLEGAVVGSLSTLFKIMVETDIWLNIGT